MEQMIKLDSLFIDSRSIMLVGDLLSLVAQFILESLEGILMVKLLIALRLMAREVVSLYLFSS